MGNNIDISLVLRNYTDSAIVEIEVVMTTDDFDKFIRSNHPQTSLQGQHINRGHYIRKHFVGKPNERNGCFKVKLYFVDYSFDIFLITCRSGQDVEFKDLSYSHILSFDDHNKDKLVSVRMKPEVIRGRVEKELEKAQAYIRNGDYRSAETLSHKAATDAREFEIMDGALEKLYKSNCAAIYNHQGESLSNEAWKLEIDFANRPHQAAKKFEEAKAKFQKAEQPDNLKIVDLKIKGNCHFNEGLRLEGTAYKLFQHKHYGAALHQYKKALDKYKVAKEDFDEGALSKDSRFVACSEFTNMHIEDVLEVMEDIHKLIVRSYVAHLTEESKDKGDGGFAEGDDLRKLKDVVLK